MKVEFVRNPAGYQVFVDGVEHNSIDKVPPDNGVVPPMWKWYWDGYYYTSIELAKRDCILFHNGEWVPVAKGRAVQTTAWTHIEDGE